MKRVLAGILTVGIMILMIGMGLRRPVSSSATGAASAVRTAGLGSPFPDASDRIEGLLGSALEGNVAAYLGAFGGPLRARLEREAQERGRAAFAAKLRKAGHARRSHAIFVAEPDEVAPDAARITVEVVFADRLERQTFHLNRTSGGWLVTDLETVRDVVPKHPPGSLATFQEPEGVPVSNP
jgi:hypothetical protein